MGDAEKLLLRCLELAPSFHAARHNYALVLYRRDRPEAALTELKRVLLEEPRNPAFLNSLAVVLARIGDYKDSIETYNQVLARNPNNAKIWLSYGHALGATGQVEESVRAYRRSIGIAPNLGEAYWSLANLKTFRFGPEDLETMRSRLERTDLGEEDRFHFHFALGKALEDAAEYAGSFDHYSEGNRLRRATITYEPDETDSLVRRSQALFSKDFFAQRAGYGATAPDPIFVIGLPRSGSTLIEQILASHSQVEGTMELQNIINMSRVLSGRKFYDEPSKYPEVIGELARTSAANWASAF